MSVTQYIGARYVPLFAEPDQWSNERAYEPLTIVLHEGNSFTSKQAVPIGIDILNTEFWACTGNYNAQVEAYRREVQEFAGDIEAAQTTADEAKEAVELEATARETADAGLQAAIDAEAAARETADADLQSKIDNFVNKEIILFFGDSWGAPSNDTQSLAARDNGVSYVDRVRVPYGAEKYNFCDGGAGWHDTSSNLYHTNFAGQVAIASADTSFDNAKVTKVICFGGLNDAGNSYTYSQVKAGAESFITAAKNAFPNARIILCASNTRRAGAANFYERLRTTCLAVNKAANDYGLEFYPALTWLLCDPSSWSSDNYHPNNHGGWTLAPFFEGILFGGNPSHLINIPLKEVRANNTAYTSTPAFASSITFDMFSGIVSGGYACKDLAIPINAAQTLTIIIAGNGESPFVYGGVPVSGYTQISTIEDYIERGMFTGVQAANYDELRLNDIIINIGSNAGTISRLDMFVNGRVF